MVWQGSFGDKLVSDALVDAVKEVTSGEQIDSSGSSLSVGDSVRVQEGPHAGMTGMISGFENTGSSEVQLNQGPHVSLYNNVLLNENHGETFAEDDANAQRIADRKAMQQRANASRQRGGLTSAGHQDMTRRIAAGKHDAGRARRPDPSRASATDMKRKAAERQRRLQKRNPIEDYTPDHGEILGETEPKRRRSGRTPEERINKKNVELLKKDPKARFNNPEFYRKGGTPDTPGVRPLVPKNTNPPKESPKFVDGKWVMPTSKKKKKTETSDEYTPDHGEIIDEYVEAAKKYFKMTLGERSQQKKTEFDDPDPKKLEKKFQENGGRKVDSYSKKKTGKGEVIEINPDVQEVATNIAKRGSGYGGNAYSRHPAKAQFGRKSKSEREGREKGPSGKTPEKSWSKERGKYDDRGPKQKAHDTGVEAQKQARSKKWEKISSKALKKMRGRQQGEGNPSMSATSKPGGGKKAKYSYTVGAAGKRALERGNLESPATEKQRKAEHPTRRGVKTKGVKDTGQSPAVTAHKNKNRAANKMRRAIGHVDTTRVGGATRGGQYPSRSQYAEYTPDHGETISEYDNSKIISLIKDAVKEQRELKVDEGILSATARGVGKVVGGTAKLAGKGAVGTAKLAGKGVAGTAKLAGKGVAGTAKLAGKGLVGTAKLAGKGAVGTAKLAGKGAVAGAKAITPQRRLVRAQKQTQNAKANLNREKVKQNKIKIQSKLRKERDNTRKLKMKTQKVNEGQEKEVSRYLEKKGFDDYDFWFSNGLQVTDQPTGKKVIKALKDWNSKVYGKSKIGKASKDAKHGIGFSVNLN